LTIIVALFRLKYSINLMLWVFVAYRPNVFFLCQTFVQQKSPLYENWHRSIPERRPPSSGNMEFTTNRFFKSNAKRGIVQYPYRAIYFVCQEL